MILTQEIIRALLTACVFGSIVFFPTVVTPLVHRVLEGDASAPFLRQVFPRYFLFIVITSGAGTLASWGEPLQATGLLFICLSTAFLRQIAQPKINAWRDLEIDGDQVAGAKFRRGHRATIVLNIIQLLIAGGILARIAG
ncbi:MAG: DUF4149 domain-containing protein [Pseudomonadota bacterium]